MVSLEWKTWGLGQQQGKCSRIVVLVVVHSLGQSGWGQESEVSSSLSKSKMCCRLPGLVWYHTDWVHAATAILSKTRLLLQTIYHQLSFYVTCWSFNSQNTHRVYSEYVAHVAGHDTKIAPNQIVSIKHVITLLRFHCVLLRHVGLVGLSWTKERKIAELCLATWK